MERSAIEFKRIAIEFKRSVIEFVRSAAEFDCSAIEFKRSAAEFDCSAAQFKSVEMECRVIAGCDASRVPCLRGTEICNGASGPGTFLINFQ